MQSTKQDITKLKTIDQYARIIGKTRIRVYQMIDEGKLIPVEIAGMKFIKVD